MESNCGGAYSETERVEIPLAQTMPYTQNFNDGLMYGWTFMNDTVNQWAVGSAIDCGTEGGQSLYISDNNGMTNTYSNYLPSISYAMTNIVFGNFPAFNISFNWKANGENNCDYGKVYLLPLNYDLNLNSLPDDSYSLTDKLEQQTSWQSEDITLGAEWCRICKRSI